MTRPQIVTHGVIETGRDGVGLHDLTRRRLQEVSSYSVQNTRLSERQSCRVTGGLDTCVSRCSESAIMLPKTSQRAPLLTISTGLDTDQPNILLLDKVVERSDGVTSTSDTGDDGVRKLADLLGHLLLDLPSDDSLEITDDGGERVRTDGGSDTVVGRLQVGHPFTHGLVDGVLERLRAGSDGDDLDQRANMVCQFCIRESTRTMPTPHLSSQHPDPEHVQRLPPDILCTHVDNTLHPEPSTGGSGGDTVLSSTRLGDDLGLAESLGEQDLSDGVVDLVRTGVVQVFSPGESHG
jgi:hypothetical protein